MDNRLRLYMLLMTAFDQPRIRAENHASEDLMRVIQHQQQAFPQMQLPLAVPPSETGGRMAALYASLRAGLDRGEFPFARPEAQRGHAWR